MNKKQWRRKIKVSAEAAGTYRPYFESVIDTLSDILEKRDGAQEQYEASGAIPVVSYTNQKGQENIVKNPALVVVMELNQQALHYWRDLGLTPAGLKKLDEKAMLQKNKKNLSDVLGDIL